MNLIYFGSEKKRKCNIVPVVVVTESFSVWTANTHTHVQSYVVADFFFLTAERAVLVAMPGSRSNLEPKSIKPINK